MKKLISTMIALSLSTPLFAMPNNLLFDALATKYPDVLGTKLMDCMTCHTIDKWQRNPYGMDLEDYLRKQITDAGETPDPSTYTKAFIMKGMKAIELLDSDNDTFSNLEELANGTFPGVSTDHPVRPTYDFK